MQFRDFFFKHFAVATIIVAILNFIATKYTLYFLIPRFDMLMHFLGGIASAFLIFWLFSKTIQGFLDKKRIGATLIVVLLSFLVIALLWEGLEFSIQGILKAGNLLADIPDSINDTVMGLIGALFGTIYGIRKNKELRN